MNRESQSNLLLRWSQLRRADIRRRRNTRLGGYLGGGMVESGAEWGRLSGASRILGAC